MSTLLLSCFGVLLAAVQPQSPSTNAIVISHPATTAADTNSTVEVEYKKLLEEDDAAQGDVDRWLEENDEAAKRGAALSNAELSRRIRDRFEPVRTGYESFLKRNPTHADGHIAFGSFLGDIGDEEGARTNWERALELDPKNPAIYNNLAGIYSHSGPVTNSFKLYAKAIELNPREPVYYHNFGTVIFLFRSDAKEYYKIDEQQVFAKAFELYSNSMRLDPGNFPLASDVAQTYYGVNPLPTDTALKAWTNTYAIARDEIEREGVHVHFARVKALAGRFEEARSHLNLVTNEMYAVVKDRLKRNLVERETKPDQTTSTNNPSVSPAAR